MKLLIVIEPIASLNPIKDSSIALFRAAFKQGIEIFYTTLEQLAVKDGIPFGVIHSLTVNDKNDQNWYQQGRSTESLLADMDIIIMRKDPPFDMNYVYATYLLELAERQGVLVANKPQSLRDCNEKYFTSFFPALCAPTLISQDMNRLKQFHNDQQEVIYKPLDGMGGQNIFHVDQQAQNINVVLEILTDNGQTPIMAQRYIPAIKVSGDKRVLVINGKVIPYGLARLPQGDDMRGNLARGAKAAVAPLSKTEITRCETLTPTLLEKGLYLVGLDLIGDYITEINVTSPTGFRELEADTKLNLADEFISALVIASKQQP